MSKTKIITAPWSFFRCGYFLQRRALFLASLVAILGDSLAVGAHPQVDVIDMQRPLTLLDIRPFQTDLSYDQAKGIAGNAMSIRNDGSIALKPLFLPDQVNRIRVIQGPVFDAQGSVVPGAKAWYQTDGHHRSFAIVVQQAFAESIAQENTARGIHAPLSGEDVRKRWASFDTAKFLSSPVNEANVMKRLANVPVYVRRLRPTSGELANMYDSRGLLKKNLPPEAFGMTEGATPHDRFISAMRKNGYAYVYESPLDAMGASRRPPSFYTGLRDSPLRGVAGAVGFVRQLKHRIWEKKGADYEEFEFARRIEGVLAAHFADPQQKNFCFTYTSSSAIDDLQGKEASYFTESSRHNLPLAERPTCHINGEMRTFEICKDYLLDIKTLRKANTDKLKPFDLEVDCKPGKAGAWKGEARPCRRCISREEIFDKTSGLTQTDYLHLALHIFRDEHFALREIEALPENYKYFMYRTCVIHPSREEQALETLMNSIAGEKRRHAE